MTIRNVIRTIVVTSGLALASFGSLIALAESGR